MDLCRILENATFPSRIMLIEHWTDFKTDFRFDPKGNAEEYLPYYEDEDDVETSATHILQIDYVGSYGIDFHVDEFFPRYSYHLILINRGMTAHGEFQYPSKMFPQNAGDIICLDIHRYHCLSSPSGMRSPDIFWISACLDTDKRLTKSEAFEIFNEFLRKY